MTGPRFDAAELRPVVDRSVRSFAHSYELHGRTVGVERSPNMWWQLYAARFGLSERQARRDYSAVRDGGTLEPFAADRVATFCGIHPGEVFGATYDAWVPMDRVTA